LIAVDDGSPDGTLARLRALDGDDLRIVVLEKNRGVATARNRALEVARGEYVAFLDADDEWLPGKLDLQIQVLEEDPAVAVSTCDSLLVRLDGSTIRHHETTTTASGPDAWRTLLRGNFIPTTTVVTRRSLLEQVGGFDEGMPLGEDYDLWLKLAGRGGIHVHPEVLLRVYAQKHGLSRETPRGEIEFVVPMLERQFGYFADRMTPAEIRSVRGHNCFDIAIRAMQNGDYGDARRLFSRSLLGQHRIARSLYGIARCLAAELASPAR
jgi:glycosyltransferase involved in cell wall biosynthesis